MQLQTVRRRATGPAVPSPLEKGPAHLGWQQLRAALRGAGVAPGLVGPDFRARLGRHGRGRPTAHTVVELLDTYFEREARDLREGRYVAYREGHGSARHIVARIAATVPELGPLTLVEEREAGTTRFVLRTVRAHEALGSHEVAEDHFPIGDSTYIRRTVSVDALVEAANRLLAQRGLAVRFLPIDAPDDVCAYLAVDWSAACKLDAVGLWDAPLEDLLEFADWPEHAEPPDEVIG